MNFILLNDRYFDVQCIIAAAVTGGACIAELPNIGPGAPVAMPMLTAYT